MACTRKLLAARPRLYPQFATHNALTVASVIEDAGGVEGYEFQRLHGMGEALYELLLERARRRRLPRLCAGRRPSRPARLSGAAAAGERRELLVRVGRGRSVGADRRPSSSARSIGSPTRATRAIRTSRCRATSMRRERRNSAGVEFGDRASLAALLAEIRDADVPAEAAPLIDGVARAGVRARGPSRRSTAPRSARCAKATTRSRAAAMAAAAAGFAAWAATPVDDARRRARTRRDLLEAAARPA